MTDSKRFPLAGSAGLIVAMIVGSGVSHLGTSTLPFQIGALIDGRGLSASEAGLFGFFEVGALAATMILVSAVIDRFRSSTVALVGAALTILAHLLMYAITPGLAALLALGAAAGVGYGLVFAGIIAGGSVSPNPDRLYAIGNGGGVLFVVAVMLLIPLGASWFGVMGPFLAIAFVLLATAPAMWPLRARARPSQGGADGLMREPGVVPLIILWAAYSLGAGALWSFAERIGTTLSMSPATIATILSASTAAGVLGTGVTAVTSGRVRRVPAMIVGLTGTAVSCLMIGYAVGPISYAIGVMAYWIFYMYQYSLFLGTAAVLDAKGRVGTLGGGCERFAFAVGAPVGGFIADHSSYSAIGLFGFVACVVALPFCLPAIARRLDGRSTMALHAPPTIGGPV